MLIAYSFNLKDEAQALKNAQWMSELRNQGKHKFLIVHDSRCDPKQIKEILSKSFEIAGALSVRDHWNKWPESANQMWCETARYIEYTLKEPWLWLEPDAIFVKETGLDKLEAEYKRGNRPFMGGFVPKFHDSPDHMTGVSIYPGEVIKYAGVMLMSAGEPVPFDLIAAPQVAAQAHFTDLIQHRWSPAANPNPPFTSVEDMKERMTSECVLYHSDKSGSLCDILREQMTKPTTAIVPKDKGICFIENCGKPVYAAKVCRMHYARKSKYGSYDLPPAPTLEDKLMANRMVVDNGCWIWTAGHYPQGYGEVSIPNEDGSPGKQVHVHRAAYELYVGVIPNDLHVCHKCDVKSCFNPDHLFLGTDTDNMQDATKKGRLRHGENHMWTKLSDQQVEEIREKYESGVPQPVIAAEYKCSQANISAIVSRKTRAKKTMNVRQPKEGETNNGMVYRNGAWNTLTKIDKLRANAAKARAAKAAKHLLKKK